MANTSKTRKGPKVMPTPRRAPNPRTPRPAAPRRAQDEGESDAKEEGDKDAEAPVAEGQAVEPPTDAQSQPTGTGGGGNQP